MRAAATLAVGAAAGALCLGGGGRIAMWLFARLTDRVPIVTVGGTLQVLLFGAIAGLLGGVVLLAVRRWLPARPVVRGLTLGTLCYGLASPGLRPPVPLVFALFAPPFLLYGVLTTMMDARLRPPPGSRPGA